MFSVIIPAYNCEGTICRVLDSVKGQTRFDLIEEIIIINDGSKDNTNKVIKEYIYKNPNLNIKYEIQDNHGVSYTRNRGIKEAKGEWIALLDSDDLWKEEKIERQYNILMDHPEIVFLGATYPLKFILKKKGLYKVSANELCIRSCPSTPSVIFKKSVGFELGLFDESRKYTEDIQFFQKFLLKDSYYVLAENLVDISFQKKYYATSGLSSNLKEMHNGRNKNLKEMYEMKLISKPFMLLMFMFNEIKYIRRKIIKRFSYLLSK